MISAYNCILSEEIYFKKLLAKDEKNIEIYLEFLKYYSNNEEILNDIFQILDLFPAKNHIRKSLKSINNLVN